MKIHELIHQQVTDTNKAGSARSVSGLDFKQMLEARLQAVSPPQKTGSVETVGNVGSVPPALRVESLSLADTAIDSLDSYRQALGNKQIDSRDLSPFISELEEKTAALLDMRDQMSAEDPLGKLLERISTVTYIESAKYHRGDYS